MEEYAGKFNLLHDKDVHARMEQLHSKETELTDSQLGDAVQQVEETMEVDELCQALDDAEEEDLLCQALDEEMEKQSNMTGGGQTSKQENVFAQEAVDQAPEDPSAQNEGGNDQPPDDPPSQQAAAPAAQQAAGDIPI